MISRELIAASSTILILSILEENDSYGYMIIKKVKDISKNKIEWTDGMLYPVLHRLESRGFIDSYWKESSVGRKRKYYKITGSGKEELKKEKEQWLTVNHALNEVWSLNNV